MKLRNILAGFGILLLASMPAAAQRNGAGHAGAAGAPRAIPHPAGSPVAPIGSAPRVGMRGMPLQNPRPRFAAQLVAPPVVPPLPFRPTPFRPLRPGGLNRGLIPGRIRLRYDLPFDYYYPLYYQSFGVPMCGPFFQATPTWPSLHLGGFSCASGSFFSLGYMPPYSASFPPEPYQPMFGTPTETQLYALSVSGFDAGNLDMIAAEAARESAESDPRQTVTQLVLKEGIIFGVVDYWTENGKLTYITTFGIQHSITLDELDQPKTEKLNSARGINFVLRERPATPTQ